MQAWHTDIEQSSRPKLPPRAHKEGPKVPKMRGPKIPARNVGPSHDFYTKVWMGTYVIKIYRSFDFTVNTFIQIVLWYRQKSLAERHILKQVKYGALWRPRTAQMHSQHFYIFVNKHFLKYNSSWRSQVRRRHGPDMISLEPCRLKRQHTHTLRTSRHCSQRASAVYFTNAALRTTPTTTEPNTDEVTRTLPTRTFKRCWRIIPPKFTILLLLTLSRM
jgi:hypothetical protein